jgi:hypothetical protein
MALLKMSQKSTSNKYVVLLKLGNFLACWCMRCTCIPVRGTWCGGWDPTVNLPHVRPLLITSCPPRLIRGGASCKGTHWSSNATPPMVGGGWVQLRTGLGMDCLRYQQPAPELTPPQWPCSGLWVTTMTYFIWMRPWVLKLYIDMWKMKEEGELWHTRHCWWLWWQRRLYWGAKLVVGMKEEEGRLGRRNIRWVLVVHEHVCRDDGHLSRVGKATASLTPHYHLHWHQS